MECVVHWEQLPFHHSFLPIFLICTQVVVPQPPPGPLASTIHVLGTLWVSLGLVEAL